jgi:long-chain fatty acid transport protein
MAIHSCVRDRVSPGALVLALFLFPTTLQAGGFRIVDQGAAATAQSGAFIAQADDPSAVYYNPAALPDLRGVQLLLGTTLIGGSIEFTGPTGNTARGDLGGSTASPPPSQLFLTVHLPDVGVRFLGDLSVGLGVVAPFGTNVRWPDNGPFATALTRAALELIDIKPTLAYRLNHQLAVGIGADIYTFADSWGAGRGTTRFNLMAPSELNGRDTTAGFNASVLYTPWRNQEGRPLVNIGFQYRSQAVMDLRGQFLVNGAATADASTHLTLPQVFTGGVAVWPLRDQEREWKLEVDVDVTGWQGFRNTDVRLSNGMSIPFPQHWRNSVMTMLGTEYRWRELPRLPMWEVALRGGYWYSQTPVPDQAFSPAVPDSDQHAVSIGLGLLCKRNGFFAPGALGLDLAYQAILYETRTVQGSQNPLVLPPNAIDGTYKTMLHVGAISLRMNF